MRMRRGLCFAVLAAAMLSPVAAHRGHDALTVVTISGDGSLTVSHRFEASDIEPALGEIAPDAQPSLDDPEAVAALVAYLGRHFTLSSERGPIALTPGKVDLGSSEVRVAFIARTPRRVRRLTIRSDLLGDVYPGQYNQVDVRFGSTNRTLLMAAGDVETIELSSHKRGARRARLRRH